MVRLITTARPAATGDYFLGMERRAALGKRIAKLCSARRLFRGFLAHVSARRLPGAVCGDTAVARDSRLGCRKGWRDAYSGVSLCTDIRTRFPDSVWGDTAPARLGVSP